MKHCDFMVVGAGSAGRTAIETLREEVPDARLILVDAEPVLPYKRTNVSKNVADGFLKDQFAVHDESWYRSRNIDLITGAAAEGLNPESASITVNGERIAYRGLLLALGARPILPFSRPSGNRWSFLWNENEGRTLHRDMASSASRNSASPPRVLIVGMGVLGVEAAWQAHLLRAQVSILGLSDYPMARYLDPLTAEVLTRTLRREGVQLFFNQKVIRISESSSQSDNKNNRENAEESPGKSPLNVETDLRNFEADYLIIAAGSKPEVQLAESAGLQVNRGIVVDSALRSSHPGIWAAGDCAEHPGGEVTGIWHAAENQGKLAALSMLGRKVNNNNPLYRLKCEVFGGYWFSAGFENGFENAEAWNIGENLWRPRFDSGRLTALTGALPAGLSKTDAKAAQALVLEGARREKTAAALGFHD